MSSNPQCALDALLTPSPITLGQVALLEKIDSPLLREGELLAADVIPSLSVSTAPARRIGVILKAEIKDSAD